MKLKKRFYVGSIERITPQAQTGVLDSYSKETIEEAVGAARIKLAADPKLSAVPIVQIVRVVRRATAPVIVEKVTA